MVGKKRLGDDAIIFVLQPRIDRAQHLAQAQAPLRGQARIRRRFGAAEGKPIASECFEAIGGLVIERDNSRRRSAGTFDMRQLRPKCFASDVETPMDDWRRDRSLCAVNLGWCD